MRQLATRKLVLATHNAGKLTEFRGLVAPFGIEVVSAGELGLPEPEETGTTFEANAATKALAASRATGLVALSDDSGLEVDALGNQPGVYTADWATLPDGSRDFKVAMLKVEDALANAGATLPAQRQARFVATLCLAWPDGETQFFRDEAAGTLVWPPRGTDGFGYDPVFLPDGQTRTFGEMTAGEKHGWKPGDAAALSHRARAFKLFAETHLMRNEK
jgi:XTP/dITP diphosphohydrolase